MNTQFKILSAALLSAVAMSATVEARTINAPVVRVTPVTAQVAVPEEVCRDERVVRSRKSHSDTAGTVVGAIIGGALGNQVGKGDGRTAATVGGAIIGGAVGRNVDRRNNQPENYVEYERVCYTQNRWETQRMYDVTYRYRGRLVTDRFDRHPGRFVTIRD
jgi:uncharacterized protein YcfJ